MERSDTDDLCTKIEALQWILFVIFGIKNGKMVEIEAINQNASVFVLCV